MNKRTIIRVGSYLIALFAVLSVFAVNGYTKASQYKLQLENSYQQSLNELSEYMGNIEIGLNKGIYANTDTMVSELSSDLWRECSGAKSAMSKLPLSDLNLEKTYKFLSQVGEFALSLNKKLASGGEITDEEHQFLVNLSAYAKSFNKSIDAMIGFYNSGASITGDGSPLAIGGNMRAYGLDGGFTDTEESMTDYPTLIYDGPFSDHLMNQESQMTKGKAEISRSEAQQVINDVKGFNIGLLNYDGMEESRMPCYTFSDKNANYAVTKMGGYLCSVLNNREIGNETISLEQAVQAGQQFLKDNGFTDMEPTYYAKNDGICVINYAYTKNGVTFYTDLIKVGVALDNGQAVSFDARGYLVNHKERALKEPAYSQEDCAKRLSPYLTATGVKKAVIPTETNSEVYAYEFHCMSKSTGEELLVYFDTQTGKEADILFMLYTDDGIFVK